MVRPHIVRIRQSVVFIKTMLKRQELLLISQMPFSEDSRRIPFVTQQLRHRLFLLTDAIR